MEKHILIFISLLLVICLIGVFVVDSSKIIGEAGLIATARKEIKNLAEVDTIEMQIVGKSTRDGNRHLFWIMTGNEYQGHSYYPLEVTEIENEVYKFVHLYNGGHQRGRDIFFEFFGSGYSFMVNNPECKGIVIGETVIPVSDIPFVYYYPQNPNEYYFIDAEGNRID